MIQRLIAVGVVCLMAGFVADAVPAAAQYMFLDVDGDGAYTYVDQYACADTLDIDVYLVTDTSEYGSPISCAQDGSGVDVNSYSINLYATESPVQFSNLTNHMAGMLPIDAPSIYPYAFHVAYGGLLSFPPGKHRLFSFTAVGCASLSIVPSSCYSPQGTVTSFGSTCPGTQSDYTLRLGEDWFGALGLGHTDPLGSWPTVTCPAAITGIEGRSISFPVTVNDPDCGIWSFYAYGTPAGAVMSPLGPFVAGDATGTFTWTPALGQAGTYAVTFDASDYPNPFHGVTQRDTCTTIITIRTADLTARVFTSPGDGSTRLPNGKPTTCFRIESLPGEPFAPEDVVPGAVTLRYNDPVCGALEVNASASKSRVLSDIDRNGISEYEACFSRDALRTIGSCLSPGAHTVPLEVTGELRSGDRFRGVLMHRFNVAGGNLAAAITPNPLNRGSILEFTTQRTGSMTARLFDIRGRFLATLVEWTTLEAGSHRMPLTALGGLRDRLSSGVYFVRIATEHDGAETRTVTILK